LKALEYLERDNPIDWEDISLDLADVANDY
jgi:hypothetical protein